MHILKEKEKQGSLIINIDRIKGKVWRKAKKKKEELSQSILMRKKIHNL